MLSNADRFSNSRPPRSRTSRMILLYSVLILGVLAGMAITPSLFKRDFTDISQKELARTSELREELDSKLQARQIELNTAVAEIDAGLLRQSAIRFYQQELAGRRSYDQRFALSPRERAQLHMKMLSTDTTRTFHDAISSVAREAAPRGSDISVRESRQGIELHIYFDMSTMTSGEQGTRTKHNTVASLKKEVGTLISRVMNDVAMFCRDLNLSTIHVACRHYVKTSMPGGRTQDVNTVLYKVHIQPRHFADISSNPFLDIYSSSDHFVVDTDNFDTLEIIRTR